MDHLTRSPEMPDYCLLLVCLDSRLQCRIVCAVRVYDTLYKIILYGIRIIITVN